MKRIMNFLERLKQKRRSESAAAPIAMVILSIPYLLLMTSFALDTTKNVYIRSGYTQMAQHAVEEGVRHIDARGFIKPEEAAKAIVAEYMFSRKSSEFVPYVENSPCMTVDKGYGYLTADNLRAISPNNQPAPMIIISFSNKLRTSTTIAPTGVTYVYNGGKFDVINRPGMLDDTSGLLSGINLIKASGDDNINNEYNAISATFYDTTDNLMMDLYQLSDKRNSLQCQYFNNQVSAVKFGSSRDLRHED